MEKNFKDLIDENIKELNLVVDSIKVEKENNLNFLRICLDSEEVIDLNKIVAATKIINPILENNDLIKEEYILDVYGKSKGE